MPIQIISELFTITGCTNPSDNLRQSSSYSITTNYPVSYEVSSPWTLMETGNIGNVKVSSSAKSLEIEAKDESCETFTCANATAEAILNFKQINNTITLDFSGYVDMHYFENEVNYKFEHISSDGSIVLLDSKKWTTEMSEEHGSSDRFIIKEQAIYKNSEPDSSYRIRLFGKVSCGDNPGAGVNLKVIFKNSELPAPEHLIVKNN